jgi:lipid A 3-O-deacylase
MARWWWWLAAAACAGPVLGSPAAASDGIISEYRLGPMYHDAGVFGHRKEHGADVNLEALFNGPDWLSKIGSPRPHLGFEISTAGMTDKAYFGLTWTWTFFDRLFFGFSVGGAAHDGFIKAAPLDRKELGSRFEFRESAEGGVLIGERHSISLILDHISNAKLGVKNDGMDGLGIRYGYRF